MHASQLVLKSATAKHADFPVLAIRGGYLCRPGNLHLKALQLKEPVLNVLHGMNACPPHT